MTIEWIEFEKTICKYINLWMLGHEYTVQGYTILITLLTPL